MKFKKGFTFIELLVVVAIFALLTLTVAVGFHYFQSGTILNSEMGKIMSAIRLAQNKAVASEANQDYGIYFDITGRKYILFNGDSYATTSATNIAYSLQSQIQFTSVNLNSEGQAVVFNHVNGTTNQYGLISLALIANPSQPQTILINPSGETYPFTAAVLSLPPNRDSRHTLFNYGKNTQNAITLRLTFPNDSFNYDIVFQNYLNASKNAFYWQGAINVNGQNQIMEIKTYSLLDTAAQFSIKRDKRYNNKAVQILLDNDNLINYQDNGSTTKGTSPFVSEPQWQ